MRPAVPECLMLGSQDQFPLKFSFLSQFSLHFFSWLLKNCSIHSNCFTVAPGTRIYHQSRDLMHNQRWQDQEVFFIESWPWQFQYPGETQPSQTRGRIAGGSSPTWHITADPQLPHFATDGVLGNKLGWNRNKSVPSNLSFSEWWEVILTLPWAQKGLCLWARDKINAGPFKASHPRNKRQPINGHLPCVLIYIALHGMSE